MNGVLISLCYKREEHIPFAFILHPRSKMPHYRGYSKKVVIEQSTTGALRASTTGQQLHTSLQRSQITASVLPDQTRIEIILVRTICMLQTETPIRNGKLLL